MNTRTPNNALAAPTSQEEMSKFAGFSSNNGEVIPPDDASQRRSPVDDNLSPEERKAGVKIVGEQPRGKATAESGKAAVTEKPAKVELSDAEKTTALDALRTELKLTDDEELTPDEEAEALTKALADKKAASKKEGLPRDERIRRIQQGRRNAEARAAKAEGKIITLEQRLAALENGGKAPLTPATKTGNDDTTVLKEPQPKDFELGELDPKFIRALVRWENQQERADTSKNQQTQQRTAQEERAAAEFTAKKDAFDERGLDAYDDFQEVVIDTVTLPKSDPAAWPLSATVGRLILESEQGQHIAYLLATDPKEAKRVEKLTVPEQQRWFFKQEAKFEAENPASGEDVGGEGGEASETQQRTEEKPAGQQRQVTKAPPPPARRNNGAGSNKGGVSSATTDFAAFEAMETARTARTR